MKKLWNFLGLLAVMLALPFYAQAREGVPIIEHNDILISTISGRLVTADQVRDAITVGAASKRWEVTKSESRDTLTATLNVRGKHSVTVSIPYSAEKFSVLYLNSANMNYRLAGPDPDGSTDLTRINTASHTAPPGAQLIHPNYNRWVQDLIHSVQLELKRL